MEGEHSNFTLSSTRCRNWVLSYESKMGTKQYDNKKDLGFCTAASSVVCAFPSPYLYTVDRRKTDQCGSLSGHVRFGLYA